jgi:hypothetical protein
MTADTRVKALGDIRTEHLFDMVVDLAPRLNLGQRVLFGSAGGSFDGPGLRGEVLAGGGDWAVFRPDGTMTLDVRLTLRTHDDALVFMTYGGRWVIPADLRTDLADPVKRSGIDPARYYFRTTPLFETGASEYSWLNDIVCVGAGYVVDGGIAYQVARVV